MAESVEDLDLTPPQAAQDNAQKVLDWRDEYGDEVNGMTRTGWVRANQLAEGEELSPDIVGRMAGFNRHRSNSDIDEEHEGEPWKDAGYVAWLGWGGDEGIDWAMRMSDRIDSIENSGRDKVTTLSHKHEGQTMENTVIDDMMGGNSGETQAISKNTFNGYFEDAPDFEDDNWQAAVDRLTEVHGMIRSYITSVVRHEATGHGREENVPPFEDPIDTDTLTQFADNVENNVDDETYSDLVEQIVQMDEALRKIFYDTVVHHNAMHGDGEMDVSQLLNEELVKGEDYNTMPECMDYYSSKEDMDTDQAFAICADEFDVEEEENQEGVQWSEGDMVEWQVKPSLFGKIVHIDEERNIAMVDIMDENMESTGFTISAGYSDLVEFEGVDEMAVEDIPDIDRDGIQDIVERIGTPAQLVSTPTEESEENSAEILQQGIIPNHRPLGDFSTRESDDWDRPDYSEFQDSYDFEESFAELETDDKRVVAAHFGRVDNSSYEEATYSDLQLPHHHPDNGDVDRAAVIAARQRLPQSDMPQEDLEAIDTHLVNHLEEDFGEEDVEPVIEKENAAERPNVYRDADKAVRKSREMGMTGIHTIEGDEETLYKPGATPEDFEQAKRESSEALSEGQLVSFDTDYGKSFGRVKGNEEQSYEVEVYSAELGGGWKSSGRTKTLEQKELELEDQFPNSLDDVFNNDSGVGVETVEEKDQELSEDDVEEDDGEGEEVTQTADPSKVQQVKKK